MTVLGMPQRSFRGTEGIHRLRVIDLQEGLTFGHTLTVLHRDRDYSTGGLHTKRRTMRRFDSAHITRYHPTRLRRHDHRLYLDRRLLPSGTVMLRARAKK